MKAGHKAADCVASFLEVASGHFCAWAASDQRGALSGEQRERWGSLTFSKLVEEHQLVWNRGGDGIAGFSRRHMVRTLAHGPNFTPQPPCLD